MAERIPVYRYEIRRGAADDPAAAVESRWSLVPVNVPGYAGRQEPTDAHPMGNEPAETTEMRPHGHVEAPDGTTVVSTEPPVLEIPGRGRVDLLAVMGVGEGTLSEELRGLLRFRPAG